MGGLAAGDTKATGSGAVPNHASAGAGAAAAHARSRQVKHGKGKEVAKRPTSLTRDYHDLDATQRGQYSLEGFKAASTAVRDSRATPTLPPTGITCDIPEKGPAEEAHQTVGHERAIRAASGAFASSRKRSDSAPTKPPDGFATWADACRLHHAANENARLYTSETGPVLEEQDRKGVERAAAASMTRDLDEAPMRKENPLSVSGARTSLGRSRSQRPTTKSDPAALQRAILLQYAAQNRAAERIAEMQDGLETYQMYYGTAVPSTRSRLSVRRRRTPSVGDSSMVDVERSMEIRNQMSTLQTKLDEVDEQRQKDRDNLMEAARRNVDAAIHDMELRVLADTGRAPASMQKELEEAALERAEREIEEPVDYGDLVNIGAGQFVDPAEVEEAARSRVKPTLEEMDDRVEEQRARELEERLDREEKRRVAALASEREAEIRAEEREHKGWLNHRVFGILAHIGTGRSRIWPSFRSNKRAEEQRARKAESRMDKAEEKRRHSIERQRAADIRSEEQQSIGEPSELYSVDWN